MQSVLGAFVLCGIVLLLFASASVQVHLIEAEEGMLTNGADQLNDTTASNGKAVLFQKAFTPTATPTIATSSTPQPNGNATPWLAPLPKIASNISVANFLVSAGAPNASGDTSGNFRFICAASHLAYDDPIVNFGLVNAPDKQHLHQFFGNRLANGNSTYESLRTTGDTTCDGGPVNRSAYWVPAMIDQNNKVRVPDVITLYYKANPLFPEGMQSFPPGLRMIADASGRPWYCEADQTYESKSETIKSCPENQELIGFISFPTCWDGINLDSANHRSHMSYPVDRQCPSSHPVKLPQVSYGLHYKNHGGQSNLWHLSSDRFGGTTKPNGTTFHADWYGAWDDDVMDTWVRSCIHTYMDCHTGNLGNGKALRSFTQAPFMPGGVVDIP